MAIIAPLQRCSWPTKPLDIRYHDEEWGVPLHEDRALFELLTLEGAQAGLSWSIVLAKREHYRQAFDGFEIRTVAAYDDAKVAALLGDAGIVRHRVKIASTVTNARAVLTIQGSFGSFDRYLWRFVGGQPLIGHHESARTIPTRSRESDALSADLRARGFKFVGTTICYAFMQASGMINDHLVSCRQHRICARLK